MGQLTLAGPRMNDPKEPMRLVASRKADRELIGGWMVSEIEAGRGPVSIEQAYEHFNAVPADPFFGPAVIDTILRPNGFVVVNRVMSDRPSRRGAPVGLWGKPAPVPQGTPALDDYPATL